MKFCEFSTYLTLPATLLVFTPLLFSPASSIPTYSQGLLPCETFEINLGRSVDTRELITGTGTLTNVNVGDTYRFDNAITGNTLSYDLVIRVDEKDPNSTLSFGTQGNLLQVIGAPNTDPYVIYTLALAENSSATPGNPFGTPVTLDPLTITMTDIDSDAGVDFSDVGGAANTSGFTTVTRGSQLENAGFVSTAQPNFDVSRLNPTLVGDSTNWTDEINVAVTNLDYATSFTYPTFSSAQFIFGSTGNNTEVRDRGNAMLFAGTNNTTCGNVQTTNPQAINDSRVTPFNTPVSNSVITNDIDPENDPLTVTQFSIDGTVYNPGDTVTLNEGTLALNADGSYTFTPIDGFIGEVPDVLYTITDGTGSSNAVLSITVLGVGGGGGDQPGSLIRTGGVTTTIMPFLSSLILLLALGTLQPFTSFKITVEETK